MTDANEDPVTGADVYKRKLIDDWSWEVMYYYNESPMVTDQNGEVIGSLSTPTHSGGYVLELEVINGSINQLIDRHFSASEFRLMLSLPKGKFFVNESFDITANLTYAQSGQPIENATVRIDIHRMIMNPDEKQGNEPPLHWENETSSSGIAVFTVNVSRRGDYHIEAQFDLPEGGGGSSTQFLAREFNITASSDMTEYAPGDAVHINVTVFNSTGSPLPQGTPVTISLEYVEFKGTSDNSTAIDESMVSLDSNGNASTILNIPLNATSGPYVILISVNQSGLSDEEEYMIVVHGSGSETNATLSDSGPFQPKQFINLTITTNASQNLSMAPFVLHMTRTEGAVPMSEFMGGGPGSDKETFYESPVYTNSTGGAHVMLLTRRQPGNYTAFIPFFYKNQEFFDEPADIAFVNYEVM